MAVSCLGEAAFVNKADEEASQQLPEGCVRLYLHNDESVRTTMQGLNLSWQEGDRIMVNGSAYEVDIDSDGRPNVVVSEAESYEAFYPADIVSTWGPMVPNVQFYAQGSVGSCALPMWARASKTENLYFLPMHGVLELTVAGSGSLASINVKDNAGGALCGLYKLSEGTLTEGTLFYDNVTLNCVDASTHKGTALSESGTVFYLSLPPRSYSDGLTITLSGTDGKAMVLASSTPRTIEAGKVLKTPVISYQTPAEQIFAYHFDAMAFGGDAVGGRKGYKAANASDPTGYEISNDLNAAATPGTGIISKSYTVGDAFALSESYIHSRNLQDFTLLYNTRECNGCLGLGVAGDYRAIFRTPRFAAIPDGKVCKAEVSFRMAFASNATEPIQVYPPWQGSGLVQEYYIDGVAQAIDKTDSGQWARGDEAPGLTAGNIGTGEHLLIKPEDFGDTGWHNVKLVLCSVTNNTWLNFQSLAKGKTTNGFYLDDLTATIVDYPYSPADPAKLYPSVQIAPGNASSTVSTSLNWLAAEGPALGIRTVDLLLTSSYLFETLGGDEAQWDEAFAAQKAKLDAAGISVWGIHLPYEQIDALEDNIFELSANYDVRKRGVALLSKVMEHLAVFEPRYFIAHPARNVLTIANGGLRFSEFRGYLKLSCEALVAKAAELGSVFCIENLPASDPETVCGSADHYNWFCTQVPGLKICFDATHAIVGGNSTCEEFASALGSNLATVHIHDGDSAKDVHLFPGYSGLYTESSTTIDWSKVMKALVQDCGYEGPVMYESQTYAVDCINSYNAVVDNYYTVILPGLNSF